MTSQLFSTGLNLLYLLSPCEHMRKSQSRTWEICVDVFPWLVDEFTYFLSPLRGLQWLRWLSFFLSLNSLPGDTQLYSLDSYLAWDPSVGRPVPRLNNRKRCDSLWKLLWKLLEDFKLPYSASRNRSYADRNQKTHLCRGLKYSFWHRHTGTIRSRFSKPADYKTLNSPPGLSPLTLERNVKN